MSRYLPEVLDWHGQFGPILVLDDNSTDGSREFCEKHPRVHLVETTRPAAAGVAAWGRESPARAQLWDLAVRHAEWVYISDADHLISRNPFDLVGSDRVNGWAFALYDLWDDRSHYREDHFWQGHHHPRVWLVNPHRVPDDYRPAWPERGIHVGHIPSNFPMVPAVAPSSYYIAHLAYMDAENRQEKLTRYRGEYHQMTPPEIAHAESIADPSPPLRILPFAKPIKVLVGGPVRKKAEILTAFLSSLEQQELPKRVEVTYCFVDDYQNPCPEQDILRAFVDGRGKVLKYAPSQAVDFADDHPVTHQWTTSAMDRVGMLKNEILKECVSGNYDCVWLVDSDLVLDRTVLKSLLAAQKPIISAVYWTRWNASPSICAGPQVWLKPPYQLSLPHYPEHEFRHKLGVKRALEKVGGLGACTLISRSVIEKGVNFSKPPGFPTGGLWDGEDRHFCEWARRLHVDLWADGWPDIFHIYHLQQVGEIPKRSAELSDSHPSRANTGHLVSLRLSNLEDQVGPVSVRCRIGDGTLLPELEGQIMQMERGQEKTVRIHFPMTIPNILTQRGALNLANQNRLIMVELVDCKPFGLPPTLADEFYIGIGSGASQDMTHLTEAQHNLMRTSV